MSWLGRLLNPVPAPQPRAVVIPDDIVAELEAGDDSLQATVEAALRSHLDARRRPAGEEDTARLPFWLRRGTGEKGDIDQSLRDRVTQRRAVEGRG